VSTGKVNSGRTSLAYTVTLPGAGSLVASATFKNGAKAVKIATASANVTAAGTAKLTIKLSSAARSALKKKKKLTITVRVVFQPTGGEANTVTKTVTVRAKAAKKKSRK